jgi:hypothetical protein
MKNLVETARAIAGQNGNVTIIVAGSLRQVCRQLRREGANHARRFTHDVAGERITGEQFTQNGMAINVVKQ